MEHQWYGERTGSGRENYYTSKPNSIPPNDQWKRFHVKDKAPLKRFPGVWNKTLLWVGSWEKSLRWHSKKYLRKEWKKWPNRHVVSWNDTRGERARNSGEADALFGRERERERERKGKNVRSPCWTLVAPPFLNSSFNRWWLGLYRSTQARTPPAPCLGLTVHLKLRMYSSWARPFRREIHWYPFPLPRWRCPYSIIVSVY